MFSESRCFFGTLAVFRLAENRSRHHRARSRLSRRCLAACRRRRRIAGVPGWAGLDDLRDAAVPDRQRPLFAAFADEAEAYLRSFDRNMAARARATVHLVPPGALCPPAKAHIWTVTFRFSPRLGSFPVTVALTISKARTAALAGPSHSSANTGSIRNKHTFESGRRATTFRRSFSKPP
jgi:hypothetical protein